MEARVLLTGGTGFVGINIAQSLVERGCQVVICSKRPMLKEAVDALGENVVWMQGDVLNRERLDEIMQQACITHVVHAAAITPNAEREKADMGSVIEVNCLGTLRVIEAAYKAGLKRFMYIGSVAVYGDTCQKLDPVPEDAPLNPRNTYEISKYATERLVARFAQLHDMEAVSLRLGDVFGAWEYHSGVRDTMSAPFQAARCAISAECVVLPKAGSTGWIYGKDVGEAVAAMLFAKEWNHFAYNCCGVNRWSVAEFCERLQAHYPGFTYCIKPEEAGNVSFFSKQDNGMFDMSRMKNDAGFVPRYDLQSAADDYVQWMKRYAHLMIGVPERR